jgi:ankyrin repeat protein
VVLKQLLRAGAIIDKPTLDGSTPLMVSAEEGFVAVVVALIEAGASVTLDRSGITALYLAAGQGHVVVLAALIEAGAVVDKAETTEGSTALMIAAEHDHAAVVVALLGAGANVNKTRVDGKTALYIAIMKGMKTDSVDAKDRMEVITALLAAGANIDIACTMKVRTDLETTPMSMIVLAATLGNLAAVIALLKAGADFDKAWVEVDGCTPLALAAQDNLRLGRRRYQDAQEGREAVSAALVGP